MRIDKSQTKNHILCIIGIERVYMASFEVFQTAGWCSGRLLPEWGQRGVDMEPRIWGSGYEPSARVDGRPSPNQSQQ